MNNLTNEIFILFDHELPNFKIIISHLQMDTDQTFGPDIVTKLKTTIRQRLSARHVPSLILPIQEIPYTVNGKKVLSFRFHIFSS